MSPLAEPFRRDCDPWVVVNIYKQIDGQRKYLRDKLVDYFVREHSVEAQTANEWINAAVNDGLVVENGASLVMPNIEASDLRDASSHDWYCIFCHCTGDLVACAKCEICFHDECLPYKFLARSGEEQYCHLCDYHRNDDESLLITQDRLNRLLSFVCTITESSIQSRKLPILDPSLPPNDVLVFRPISFEDVRQKTLSGEYLSLTEFHRDIITMLHNLSIVCGKQPTGRRGAGLYGVVVTAIRSEVKQLVACPTCYLFSNAKPTTDWFAVPCTPPHDLVFAKQRGFSFWPAKVIRKFSPYTRKGQEDGDDEDSGQINYDVRFFGSGYPRATVEAKNIRPIESDPKHLVPKQSALFKKAMAEMEEHRACLATPDPAHHQLLAKLWAGPNSSFDDSFYKSSPIAGRQSKGKPKVAKPVKPETPQTKNEPVLKGTSTPVTNSRKKLLKKTAKDQLESNDSFSEQGSPVMVPSKRSRRDKDQSLSPRPNHDPPSERPSRRESGPPRIITRSTACQTEMSGRPKTPPPPCNCDERVEEHAARLAADHAEKLATLDADRARVQNEAQEAASRHSREIEDVKRKQWCSWCLQEALYHCCWNTAYCSTGCQGHHWTKEHKRLCRRKK